MNTYFIFLLIAAMAFVVRGGSDTSTQTTITQPRDDRVFMVLCATCASVFGAFLWSLLGAMNGRVAASREPIPWRRLIVDSLLARPYAAPAANTESDIHPAAPLLGLNVSARPSIGAQEELEIQAGTETGA